MVAPYIPPDSTAQPWANWRSGIDGAIVAGARIAVAFLPQAQDTPNMTVRVLAGPLMIGGALTEIAAQNTGTIAAPVGNPRIDRIVLNPATGAIQVVTGTPAASPVAPAIPADRLPIARFQLAPSTTAITNSMIVDERANGVSVWQLLAAGAPSASVFLRGDGQWATVTSAPTGAVNDYVGTTAPAGWVLLDGRTIGSASSSATNRANADTQALFELLWNSLGNAEAPVSSGRGASAAADFAANKTITLPDARGRVIAGRDNMGGMAASRLTSGGAGVDGATLGAAGGTQTHTLTTAQLPAHQHEVNGASPNGSTWNPYGTRSGSRWDWANAGGSAGNNSNTLSSSDGSGQAHQNTQPTLVLNKIVKL